MPLTDHQKHEIIVRYDDGMTIIDISTKLGTSRPTVRSWVKRYNETNNLDRKKGSGRKKIVQDVIINVIRDTFNENKYMSAKDINVKLSKKKY